MNPFQASHSPNFPQLLKELNGSILLTTYQTGKVILLSSDGETVTQLVRDFDRPMGVAIQDDLMALALRNNISIFKNSQLLAQSYPDKPGVYDSLYYPVSGNNTSYIDTHDITFSKQGLIAVNTVFSCLVKINGQNSFEPFWKPSFIDEYSPGDACHLNGVCVDEERNIRYVTGFGKTNKPQGWRTNKLNGGFLVDIQTNEYLAENLPMPHSPRVYKNEIYLLLSATQELARVNKESGELDIIYKLDGFNRGLSFQGDYAFIGVSKLRKSHTFADLPIAKKRLLAGVVIVNLKSGQKEAEILYEGQLNEIYDVHFLPGKNRVNLINHVMSEKNPAVITPVFAHWITNE